MHKHPQKLVDESVLLMQGKTQNSTYKLAILAEHTFTYERNPALAEDLVWQAEIQPAHWECAE